MIKRKPENETRNEFMNHARHKCLSPAEQELSDRQYEAYKAGRKDMLQEIEDRLIISIIQAENNSISRYGEVLFRLCCGNSNGNRGNRISSPSRSCFEET